MYTPLYIKTDNSLLTSLIKIDDLIDFALKNNIKSLTITDNNMYGAYYFYKKCISNGIKPIIGLEVLLGDYKIILYCKNYSGYKSLLKIVSNDISIDNLKSYSDDLICIIPFDSVVIYDELRSIYSDIFIGYKNSREEKELKYNNLLYMNEILCLNDSDLKYLKFLKAIKDGVSVNSIFDEYNNKLVLFDEINSKYPKYIENNFKIYDMCNLEIICEKDLLPKYPCPDGMDSYGYLKKLCAGGLKKIFGDTVSRRYVDRLKYELDVINKMGFCNYFLVVWDYVHFAKSSGILVGPGRGSAAGSLVSYVLGITTIDPIKYNLLFERFLNPERVTMPDIDIDFEFTRRQEVVDYCISKYGEKRVCPIITFGTLGAKQSIRDVGRCLDIPIKTIDRLCSLIDSRLSLKENYDNDKLKKFLSTDNELINLYRIASRLEGLKRHTSIHAAGIVMSSIDLDNVIPLDKSHDFYTTGYSMEFLEELGLLKMDFLALKNLTLINDVLKEIGISFDDIPNDDVDTLKLFSNGDTNGVFQFESSGMISFLKKFKPNCFEDIVSSIALYRPGPMSNIDSFIKRKHGVEKINYIDSVLEPILKSTYGIIVYQEQIMMIAQVMAGFSFGEADILRRAMSKKKESVLLGLKDKFINGCVSLGHDRDKALQVYELILKFASYGFNRAHSVSYAMISYRIAYLKVHYPLIFMKHLLNSNIGSEIKTREYIYECKGRGINILKPDINISGLEYVINNGYLVYPLTSIKGIGYQSVLKIIEARDVPFKDIFDFITRCSFKSIGRDVFISLVFSGCFDSFGYNKRTLIENIDKILNYSDLGEIFSDDMLPILDEYSEYDSKYIMEREFENFGFYISNHPITSYKKKYNSIDLNLLSNYFDKVIDLVIYVDRVREIDTKKGDKMCFVTGSDEMTSIEVVFFPRVYNGDINVHDILYLNGKVEKRNGEYQFIVNKVLEIIK